MNCIQQLVKFFFNSVVFHEMNTRLVCSHLTILCIKTLGCTSIAGWQLPTLFLYTICLIIRSASFFISVQTLLTLLKAIRQKNSIHKSSKNCLISLSITESTLLSASLSHHGGEWIVNYQEQGEESPEFLMKYIKSCRIPV